MASHRLLPKLQSLTGKEEPWQVEMFKADLLFRLSDDSRFQKYVDDDTFKWLPANILHRGFVNSTSADGTVVTESAAQKARALELMLGVIASHIPINVLNRSFILKEALCLKDIWDKLRVHYKYRKTGAQILSVLTSNYHSQKADESHEVYWQRLYGFFEDNLMDPADNIEHCGSLPAKEVIQPTLLNTMVTLWLHGIDSRLPDLVRQHFATTLLTKSLATIREDISEAIPALLVSDVSSISRLRQPSNKFCCLCDAMKRPSRTHYLSDCQFLPVADKQFLKKSKARGVDVYDAEDDSDAPQEVDHDLSADPAPPSGIRRVGVMSSPTLKAMYGGTDVCITIDSGAESDLIHFKEAKRLHIPVEPTNQSASQADNKTMLNVVGEAHFFISLGHHKLQFSGLVVTDLSDNIVGGVPFMSNNDVYVRPKSHSVHIGDCCSIKYTQTKSHPASSRLAHIFRVSNRTTLLPGDTIRFAVPADFKDEEELVIEPRLQAPSLSNCGKQPWLQPMIVRPEDGVVSLTNQSTVPVSLCRSEQVCNIRRLENIEENLHSPDSTQLAPPVTMPPGTYYSSSIAIGQDVPLSVASQFVDVNREFDNVFNPRIGRYNGTSGPIESVVNMSDSLPPQRKGRIPQYSTSDKDILQEKFDELLDNGVLSRPEAVNVSIEYLNPSFLVKKSGNRGHRLVTAFGELAKYAKPQPSLLPNVDDTLRTIGRWKFLIKTDLSSAYYQIPLSRRSMKFCGVCSPFKGVMVYTRCAMGMPGSETVLEEVMSRVLGDLIQSGSVCKISDDLYVGGDSYESVLASWREVLSRLNRNGLRVSAQKTEICPKSTTVLGWIWSDGSISASPHRVSALETCGLPATVREMRSYIGSYKFLGKVLPSYCDVLAPLESVIAGKDSKCKITWTSDLEEAFRLAQSHLSQAKSITLPRPDDSLQIVTDASVSKLGLAATMFVIRDNKPRLAGFFNAKMKDHQTRWLPCETEALCIGTAVRYFSPFIVQSQHRTVVLSDSKPCVEAYMKLCRGEFSNSARVMTFLSILCNYGIELCHIRGCDNAVADFTSRNPVECTEPACQICKFVAEADESVVRQLSVDDVTSETSIRCFTTRSTWKHLQHSCYDLKRTHAHLVQGTRPTRKSRQVGDIRRYLKHAVIARDGVLVVRNTTAFTGTYERVIIPRKLVHGVVTAIHLKLKHPAKAQLRKIISRNFFALNLDSVIEHVSSNCDVCKSLADVPTVFRDQSTHEPTPDSIGHRFSTDVIKRCRQNILVLREDISAFTCATLIPDETAESTRHGLVSLLCTLRSPYAPPVTIRTDPAPAFRSLAGDKFLHHHGIQIELGFEKNPNKNPIAEKCVREVHAQLTRLQPQGGAITSCTLAMAVSQVNSTIRQQGLSSFEIWTQRDQYVGGQLPFADRDLILARHRQRQSSHLPSAKYKARGLTEPNIPRINVGDLVYLSSDRDKTKARDRYLVVDMDYPNCTVQKFHGDQLRSRSYVVSLTDCSVINAFDCDSAIVESDSDSLSVTSIDDNASVLSSDINNDDLPDPAVIPDDDQDDQNQDNLVPHLRPRRNVRLPQHFNDFDMSLSDSDSD